MIRKIVVMMVAAIAALLVGGTTTHADTPDTMADAWVAVQEWGTTTGYGNPAHLYVVDGEGLCLTGAMEGEYCLTDMSIYLGTGLMDYFSQDSGFWYALSHEYGHYYQQITDAATVPHTTASELQAECVAGVFAYWAVDNGHLTTDEVDSMVGFFVNFDAVESNHGTGEERVDSFFMGYNNGFAACDSFNNNV